jgi:hypothetical protein
MEDPASASFEAGESEGGVAVSPTVESPESSPTEVGESSSPDQTSCVFCADPSQCSVQSSVAR